MNIGDEENHMKGLYFPDANHYSDTIKHHIENIFVKTKYTLILPY